MNTIRITDGSKEMLPYIMVEIEPGEWQGRWWYEVHIWDPKDQCWIHDWEKDGGCWFFWNCFKKAQRVLSETWFEELERMKEEKSGSIMEYN